MWLSTKDLSVSGSDSITFIACSLTCIACVYEVALKIIGIYDCAIDI